MNILILFNTIYCAKKKEKKTIPRQREQERFHEPRENIVYAPEDRSNVPGYTLDSRESLIETPQFTFGATGYQGFPHQPQENIVYPQEDRSNVPGYNLDSRESLFMTPQLSFVATGYQGFPHQPQENIVYPQEDRSNIPGYNLDSRESLFLTPQLSFAATGYQGSLQHEPRENIVYPQEDGSNIPGYNLDSRESLFMTPQFSFGATGYQGSFQHEQEHQYSLDREAFPDQAIVNLTRNVQDCHLNEMNKTFNHLDAPTHTQIELRTVDFEGNWKLIRNFLDLDKCSGDNYEEKTNLDYYIDLIKEKPNVSFSLDISCENFREKVKFCIELMFSPLLEIKNQCKCRKSIFFNLLEEKFEIDLYLRRKHLRSININVLNMFLEKMKLLINKSFNSLEEDQIKDLNIGNLIFKSIDDIVSSCSRFPELYFIRLLYNDANCSKLQGFLIFILLEIMNCLIENSRDPCKDEYLEILFYSVMIFFKKREMLTRDKVESLNDKDKFRSILLLTNEIFPYNFRDNYSQRIINCLNNIQIRTDNQDILTEVFTAMLTLMYDKSFIDAGIQKKLEKLQKLKRALSEFSSKRHNINPEKLITVCGAIYDYIVLFKEFEYY